MGHQCNYDLPLQEKNTNSNRRERPKQRYPTCSQNNRNLYAATILAHEQFLTTHSNLIEILKIILREVIYAKMFHTIMTIDGLSIFFKCPTSRHEPT